MFQDRYKRFLPDQTTQQHYLLMIKLIDLLQFITIKIFGMSSENKGEDEVQKLMRIREKLHSNTFGSVELKQLKLTDANQIVEKEKKRLKVKDARITLEQLGFSSIRNRDNLFNLIRQGRAKIIHIEANDLSGVRIQVETSNSVNISIQHGTLLLPSNDPDNRLQTLIVTDQVKAQLQPGKINDIFVKTLCFNRELEAPQKQYYLLGSIRCVSHQVGMNQRSVWEITMKMNHQIEMLEENLKKADYIALTEKNIASFMGLWRGTIKKEDI